MVRAFVDVFPQSVLLSGMQAELLLVGTNAATHRDRSGSSRPCAGQRARRAAADLRRLDLGTVTEIVGTFVGSADTLARATRDSPAASDDRPLQEYGDRSVVGSADGGVPASLFDLTAAASVVSTVLRRGDGRRRRRRSSTRISRCSTRPTTHRRTGGRRSRAVGAAPNSRQRVSRRRSSRTPTPCTTLIGVTLLRQGQYAAAADAFREALKRRPTRSDANRNLGTALAATGHAPEAIEYLRRAVQLAPDNGGAQYELGTLLLERRQFAQAADCLRAAVRVMPDSAAAHNDLGIALASLGDLSQAIEHFRRAVTLDPAFDEARRNLASASKARPR